MASRVKAALKEKKPTGPRETAELFYISWLPETERLAFVQLPKAANLEFSHRIPIFLHSTKR